MTPDWLTFAEATATAKGDTSSNIAEMIEELTQPEGTKVPKINVEETPASVTGMMEGLLNWKTCHLPLLDLVIYYKVS